jgi:hypothetical protein
MFSQAFSHASAQDHGAGQVTCDARWLDQHRPESDYQQYLGECMSGQDPGVIGGANASTSVLPDDEIISAINTALDYADSQNLEATKRKATSINLSACDADAETNCTSCLNQNGRY